MLLGGPKEEKALELLRAEIRSSSPEVSEAEAATMIDSRWPRLSNGEKAAFVAETLGKARLKERGRGRDTTGGIWPAIDPTWTIAAEVGPSWTIPGHRLPKLAEFGPESGRLGSNSDESEQNWHEVGQIRVVGRSLLRNAAHCIVCVSPRCFDRRSDNRSSHGASLGGPLQHQALSWLVFALVAKWPEAPATAHGRSVCHSWCVARTAPLLVEIGPSVRHFDETSSRPLSAW